MSAVRVVRGDLFASGAAAFVNPVNCAGVMGAGLALRFARAWPAMLRDYQAVCRWRGLHVGELHLYRPGGPSGPRLIINLPTKDHWSNPSQLGYITAGLLVLRATLLDEGIESVAIPALGCGLGGLRWPPVRDLIRRHLDDLVGVDVLLYAPGGAP